MSPRPTTDERLQALQEDGAPGQDPVGWHYLQTLASRSTAQSGSAQALLQNRLHQALDDFEVRLQDAPARPAATKATPSPLAQLLQEMRPAPEAALAAPGPGVAASLRPSSGLRTENPRVQQFRRQLRKISVQKQVRQAIAQAPQNAGPINSHMLVLRALGLMQDISPDYLNRFMTYIDTLLCLDEAERQRLQPAKASRSTKSAKG